MQKREQDSLRMCCTKTSQKSLIKIKEQIQQCKEQQRSNHTQKEDESTINIENSQLNPFNNTPQYNLFQPCQSIHLECGQVCSSKQHQNQLQDSNTSIKRKLFNIDEITLSFSNSSFLKVKIGILIISIQQFLIIQSKQ
ncbi:unnamed protein product (macronuclear) [Paramecium tetraurelia]|uniref:Transmembrane protein n=1 Tax=Paramecium tetraurelia TaxID=5888 RepID=A0D8S7_PARTE|nr:uncharacterized protein GSPATT00014390001 [Paramecium tetraurelia]CAK79444.1 unnamed protein product [Paramecium tetraurelia]|eukprot:XP_001446841.1 hypothetical protein (macronuclear) [Paramecium tetraurelia strain d4-2]